MTENQRKLLFFLWAYAASFGRPPTLQEMVDGIGVSGFNSIAGIINALVKKGLITTEKGKSRSIMLTSKGLMEISTQKNMKENLPLDIRQPRDLIRNSVGNGSVYNAQNTYPSLPISPTNGTFPTSQQPKNFFSLNISTPLLEQMYDSKTFSGVFGICFFAILILGSCVALFGKNMMALKAACTLTILVFVIKIIFNKK